MLAMALRSLPAQSPATPAAEPGSSPDLQSLLQKALFAEEATRDLTQAANGYEALLTVWGKQRQLAATALFRLAEVRRKQDQKEEAIKLYQRFLKEFGDIDPQARLSRENLAGMGVKEIPGQTKETGPAMSPEEQAELTRLKGLAENGADRVLEPVKEDPYSSIPVLSRAALKGWKQVMLWLLDHGADPNAGEASQNTLFPLEAAAQKGHSALCQLLLDKGAKIETARGSLAGAIGNHFQETAQWLFDHGADLEDMRSAAPQKLQWTAYIQFTPLMAAVAAKDQAWVKRLLEKKVNVNNGSKLSPLHLACMFKSLAIVKMLLEGGADVNLPDTLELGDSNNVARPLPAYKASGWTPLHHAYADTAILETLLKAGAKVNVTDAKGWHPLDIACMQYAHKGVKALLEAGADPNLMAPDLELSGKSKTGVSPLILILSRNWSDYYPLEDTEQSIVQVVSAFFAALANPDAVDSLGRNAFHHFAKLPWLPKEVGDALLKAGVPVDDKGKDGYTPLAISLLGENSGGGSLSAQANRVFGSINLRNKQFEEAFKSRTDFFLANGADPGKSNPDTTTVVGGSYSERRLQINHQWLFPKLAKEPAINLYWLDYAQDYPLAVTEDANKHTPSLPELLTRWINDQKPDPNTPAFPNSSISPRLLQRVSIWRKDEAGTLKEIKIAPDATEAPVLVWGDILEVTNLAMPWQQNETKGLPLLAQMRRHITKQVTVKVGDLQKEITLLGRLHVYDPSRNEAPLVGYSKLISMLGGSLPEYVMGTINVQRADSIQPGAGLTWPGSETNNAEPQDGDVITLTASLPMSPGWKAEDADKLRKIEKQNLWIRVPGSLFSWNIDINEAAPSLLQLLSHFYSAASPGIFGNLNESAETQFAAMAKLEGKALSDALENNAQDYARQIVMWPDWAGIKIRRRTPDRTEQIIPVDLAAAMASLPAEATSEAARKADVLLQAGDVIELPFLNKLDQKWPGLDEAAIRLFTKALNGSVTVVDTQSGIFREVPVSWIVPKAVDTPAGLLLLPTAAAINGKTISVRFSELLPSIAPGASFTKLTRGGAAQTSDLNQFFQLQGDALHVAQTNSLNVPRPPDAQPEVRRRIVLPNDPGQ